MSFGSFGGFGGSPRQSLQLTPEEEESLLSSLGRAGMSTLAYIGESIDKPMAAVRGVLNGEIEEAANIIPFSDALGITSSEGLFGGTAIQVTDDEDTVYGRDLLETYGLADENVDGLGGSDWSNIDYGDALADILGFGIDMINVPMAGPAGALSKAGMLGKAAGLTDEAAAIARASGRGGALKYRSTNTLQDALKDIVEFKNPVLARQADELDSAAGALAYPNAPATAATDYVSSSTDDLMKRLYDAGAGMGMDSAAVDAAMGERLGNTMSFAGQVLPESVDRALATAIDSGIGKLGSGTVGRMARQAFDVPAAGTGTAVGQDFMGPRQQIYRDMGELQARKMSSQAALATERNRGLLSYLGDGDEQVGYYRALEAPDVDELMGQRQILAREDGTGRVWEAEPGDMDALKELRAVKRELGLMEARAKFEGVSFNTLEDSEIDYVTRHVLGMKPTILDKQQKMFGSTDPSQLLRREFTKDIPGGTAELIRLAKDTAEFQSAGDIAAEAYKRFGGGALTGEAESEFANKMLQLGEFMSKQKAEVRQAGIYGDPLNMIDQRLMSGNKAIANARAVTDTVSDYLSGGVTRELSEKSAPGDWSLGRFKEMVGFKRPEEELASRTVGDAINGVGLDRDTALDAIYRKMTPEAREELRQTLDMAGPADGVISAPNIPGDPGMEYLREALAKSALPDAMMDDIGRMQRGLQGPDPTSLVKDGLVQYNRWWKGLQTNPFPSFHVRNLGSGLAREGLRGNDPTGELGMVYRLMTGGEVAAEEALAVPGVAEILRAQGLGDEEAANGLRQLIRTYMPTDGQGVSLEDLGNTYTRVTDAAENASQLNTNIGFVGGLDGTAPTGPAQVWEQLKALVPGKTGAEARAANPDFLKPAALRGLAGRDTTRFAPVAAGEIAGEGVEIMNRIPSWINQVKRGIDPQQAARNVNKTQIDYSTRAFTPFENEMRRLGVMPFYSFSSRNIPEVASELINNPTGRTGGLFKGLSRLRSDDEFLPEHIAQTLAIPLGQSEEGDPRYLTGLGLMEEDLLGAVDTGNPLKSAGYEIMGRLSPIPKAAMEYVLGKSLFQSGYQGPRDTEDMDPQLGRLLSNLKGIATGEDQRDAVDTRSIEPLLQMIPGIRAMSTARQLTDQRKYDHFLAPLIANQLTGARVSDVSPAAMDASLQDMIANEYKSLGGRDFQNYYIPQKTKDQMSPEEIQHTLQMRALENLIRKRREERQLQRMTGR